MMSGTSARSGSGENRSRLTKSIVIKLPINQGFQVTEVKLCSVIPGGLVA